MIAIVDYGVGNLFSLKSSLARIGADCCVTGDAVMLEKADKILLPGVGAFRDAIQKLRATGLDETVIRQSEKGKPLLGVCLGMQLLFEKSFEYGEYEGLGLIQGTVEPIRVPDPVRYKIPQMGWNSLHLIGDHPLFRNIQEGDFVYFVHSYHGCHCEESTIATTEYGVPVTAAVAKDNVWATQFHPEKSGNVGLAILRAFAEN